MSPDSGAGVRAVRIRVSAEAAAGRRREQEAAQAQRLALQGWTRAVEGGAVLLHAEGSADAVEGFLGYLSGGSDAAVELESVEPEGHEQFAVRGVPAGRFAVLERAAPSRAFELCLEVEEETRAWTLPKAPSMVPADKRIAFEAEPPADIGDSSAEIWDEGPYEQGGRVAWPEAIGRGHAVFVLHGETLQGGFALQRIRAGDRTQWLLIKRRDELAHRGG